VKSSQKSLKNSSLFTLKSTKGIKNNSVIYDKRDNKDNTNLAEDIIMKKMVNLDKEKDNYDPNNGIKIDSSCIKAFNNISNISNTTITDNNDSSNSSDINKISPTIASSTTSNNNIGTSSQNNSPNITINDESFNFDTYYNSNQDTTNSDTTNNNINDNSNNNNNNNSDNGKINETGNKDEKKNVSMLIEKQIDDHISSITNATTSSNTNSTTNDNHILDTSVNDQMDDDQSDLRIDDQFESILRTLADENFEDIMKERQNLYVDGGTFIMTSIQSPDNVLDKDIENTSIYLDGEKKFKSPYVSTSQLEKSFKVISQALDLSEDFEKGKSKKILDNMLLENNPPDQKLTQLNINPKSVNNDKEGQIFPGEDNIQEQFYKKMWNVWEKYLSGDTVNKNRQLIRFPCIHNQAL